MSLEIERSHSAPPRISSSDVLEGLEIPRTLDDDLREIVVVTDDREQKLDEKEHLLHEWIRLSETHAEMHTRCEIYYRRRFLALTVPALLLSCVAGTTTITGALSTLPLAFDVAVGLLSYAAVALTGVCALLRFGELGPVHNMHAAEFEKLARDIRMELVLQGTRNRTYASRGEFIKDCGNRINSLIDSAPVLVVGGLRPPTTPRQTAGRGVVSRLRRSAG